MAKIPDDQSENECGTLGRRLRSGGMSSELTVLGACPLDCPDTCSWVVTVRDGEDPAEIVKRVLNEAGRNTIVLLHESRATVAALPRLLTRLARRGYTFVTVADLRG